MSVLRPADFAHACRPQRFPWPLWNGGVCL